MLLSVRVEDSRATKAHGNYEKYVRAGVGTQGGRGQSRNAGVGTLITTHRPMVLDTARMVLPRTLIRLLHREYPLEFERRLSADTDKLRQFWSGFLKNPITAEWASRHPFLKGKSLGELITTVPCTIHTDAGPCSKNSSCNCVSWSVLQPFGDEKVTKFLSYSYLKSVQGGDTPSWNRLLADFDELGEGMGGGRRSQSLAGRHGSSCYW